MENQTIITILITGIIVSKIIIGFLLYELIRKNRILKREKVKLLGTNIALEEQADQIKKYNEELKASELFKIKVLSIASHDLRTPFVSMSVLLNAVDLSLMSKLDMEQVLMQLGSELSHSQNMLDEVLLWAESQLRDNLENKETFNISQQIQHVLLLFQKDLMSNNISLEESLPKDVYLYMSRDIFSFVIRNIVSNAVKFCKYAGKITLGVSEIKGDELLLYIENEGINMPESTVEKLNNRNSWDHRKAVNGTGAGLGVSLCKDLLQRVGGKIYFENISSVGTIVFISFPIHTITALDDEIINKENSNFMNGFKEQN